MYQTTGKGMKTPLGDIRPIEMFMCSVVRRTFELELLTHSLIASIFLLCPENKTGHEAGLRRGLPMGMLSPQPQRCLPAITFVPPLTWLPSFPPHRSRST